MNYERKWEGAREPSNSLRPLLPALPDYYRGVVAGFLEGGVALVSDGVSLFKWAIRTTWNYSSLGLTIRMFNGDTFEAEKRLGNDAAKTLKTVARVAWKVQEDHADVIEALLTGNLDEVNRISEPYRLALEAGVELLVELAKETRALPAYDKGKLVGRVAFEIVGIVLAELKVGQAVSKLSILQKMKGTAYFADEASTVGRAFKHVVVPLIDNLLTTKMCFVAGTKVHTNHGLKPIEEVRRGDLVLSRDEATGEQSYREVVETVVTHPSRLYHVRYRVESDAESELVCTAEHPFHVVGRAAFVPAGELRPGDRLSLADGSEAEVTALTTEEAVEGESFTTYNFEVAEFHTYFVGDAGVWVHNASTLCEKAFSIWQRHRTALGESPETAFKTVERVLKTYINPAGAVDEPMYIQHIGDVLDEVFKKDVWPSGAEFWSPGPPGAGGRNAYSHYIQHVIQNKSGIPGGEFPDIHDAVTYVKRARAFLDTADPDAISWTAGGNRYVFHKTDHLFALEDVSSSSDPGIIRSFFHSNLKDKNGNLLTAYEWVRRRGYTGPEF